MEESAPPIPSGKEQERILGAEDLQQRTRQSPGCRQAAAFRLDVLEGHARDQSSLKDSGKLYCCALQHYQHPYPIRSHAARR
jgi:hypothetical protein